MTAGYHPGSFDHQTFPARLLYVSSFWLGDLAENVIYLRDSA